MLFTLPFWAFRTFWGAMVNYILAFKVFNAHLHIYMSADLWIKFKTLGQNLPFSQKVLHRWQQFYQLIFNVYYLVQLNTRNFKAYCVSSLWWFSSPSCEPQITWLLIIAILVDIYTHTVFLHTSRCKQRSNILIFPNFFFSRSQGTYEPYILEETK